METNTDRGIWSIVVIIAGIVIAASLLMLAPGYFSGLNQKYKDDVIGSIKKEPTEEEILQKKTLIVTFDSNEGTEVPSQEVKYRAQAEVPDNPTRLGYTFNQWMPNIDMQVIQDTMFTAKWDLNIYNVTFNTGPGATVVPSQKVKHGDKALRPSDPTNEGYDFLGWEPSISADIKADTEFKAQWELTKHNVSFANTGDSTVPSQQVTHGFITALPGDPQMAGHNFKGWSPEIGQAITQDTVFTAEWTGNWYDVTFDTGEGATKIPQTTVLYGKTVDKPASPTKEGYQFVGWSPEITSPIKKDTLFIAEWKANVYNVTFNTTGGTPTPAAQKINYDERAITPLSPTKYGYVFDGWSPSVEDTDIRKDTVFSAKWKTDQFKVMFDSNGGSQGTSTQYVDYQKAPSNPGNPTRVGYEFVRWNPAITTKITKDTTFTAEWRIKSYQVNFDTGGGTSIPSQTVAHGSNIAIPEDPTRSGSEFLGWNANLGQLVTSNLTFQAIWDTNQHQVDFDFAGGLLKDTTFNNETFSGTTQGVEHGAKPLDPFANLPSGLLMIPKPGHKFTGWSPSLNTAITSGGNKFTAQWERDLFNVTFNSAGGTAVASQKVLYNGKATVPTSPTRTGYTFAGWSPAIGTVITKDTNFTATWTLNSYVVSFNSVGGTAYANQSIKYGARAANPGSPAKTGHTFTGWSPSLSTVITGNRTFTAQYSVNKYTATFNSAGGTTYPTQSISYGSTVSNPGNPTRTGYTFTGWSPSLSTVMTGNRTFTAQWKVNTYTVSFNSNGGSAVGNQTIAYGSKAAVPANPTRRNYVFNGWSPSISTTITGNRTFTAQWLYQDALYTYRAVTGGYEIAGFNTADFKNQPGGRQPTALTIPTNYRGSTIISIGPKAFQNKSITSVSMPNSIQYIKEEAFEGSLFTSIKLPTELREVQYAAFFDGKLRGVTLPGKLHTIGRSAFNKNEIQKHDSNRLNIPNSVTSIEYRAFHNNWIGNLAIPNSVKTIGGQAFHDNRKGAKAYANILSGDRADPLRLRGYDFTVGWSRGGASPY